MVQPLCCRVHIIDVRLSPGERDLFLRNLSAILAASTDSLASSSFLSSSSRRWVRGPTASRTKVCSQARSRSDFAVFGWILSLSSLGVLVGSELPLLHFLLVALLTLRVNASLRSLLVFSDTCTVLTPGVSSSSSSSSQCMGSLSSGVSSRGLSAQCMRPLYAGFLLVCLLSCYVLAELNVQNGVMESTQPCKQETSSLHTYKYASSAKYFSVSHRHSHIALALII